MDSATHQSRPQARKAYPIRGWTETWARWTRRPAWGPWCRGWTARSRETWRWTRGPTIQQSGTLAMWRTDTPKEGRGALSEPVSFAWSLQLFCRLSVRTQFGSFQKWRCRQGCLFVGCRSWGKRFEKTERGQLWDDNSFQRFVTKLGSKFGEGKLLFQICICPTCTAMFGHFGLVFV